MIVIAIAIGICFYAGRYASLSDVEIWNGQVVSKEREHGSYVESYSCRCRTVYSGSGENRTSRRVCDTCYRTHYTVTWTLDTTIGNIRIDHLDRTSRRVYRTPDPQLYTDAVAGTPVSREMGYTNYIRAADRSLFGFDHESTTFEQFEEIVPEYPEVYDRYQIDRVLLAGFENDTISNAATEIDNRLDHALRTMGPDQEVNIVMVVANTPDRNFRYALEHDWYGGKKNDVIVVTGVDDSGIILWADAFTMAGNFGNTELVPALRRELMNLPSFLETDTVANTIINNVTEHYTRVPMEEFEYLRRDVSPPVWVVVVSYILSLLISAGLLALFHNIDFSLEGFNRRRTFFLRNSYRFRNRF